MRPTPRWFIDEVGYAGRENLDTDHVARYDAKEDSVAAAEVALLRELGLGSQSTLVEFVYSRLALHHLPDFWKALALQRARGILRPGGVLRLSDVVYDLAPAEAEAGIEAWCATGGDDVESGWTREEPEEHVRDEHSTFTWILAEIIRRTGFEIESERSSDGIMRDYVLRAV